MKKKIRAKAKTPKGRRLTQKRLEETLTPLEVHEAETKRFSKKHTMPMGELRNVIAETISRVFSEEFGQHLDQVNAREYYADRVAWAMKYGGWNEYGYAKMDEPIPMRECSYHRVPRCKQHRR